MVREKRGGKGRQGEDAWSVKYESIKLWCSQRTKNFEMLPSEIANPNIKLLYLWGLEAIAKPHKTQVQSTWVL